MFTTYSWRKVLGSEAQHGIGSLPRGRPLGELTALGPLPKLLRLTSKGKLMSGVFRARDHQHALHAGGQGHPRRARLAEQIGGLPALIARARPISRS